jgi:hypothetical protein
VLQLFLLSSFWWLRIIATPPTVVRQSTCWLNEPHNITFFGTLLTSSQFIETSVYYCILYHCCSFELVQRIAAPCIRINIWQPSSPQLKKGDTESNLQGGLRSKLSSAEKLDVMVDPPLSLGYGYGIVLGLGFVFAFGRYPPSPKFQNQLRV